MYIGNFVSIQYYWPLAIIGGCAGSIWSFDFRGYCTGVGTSLEVKTGRKYKLCTYKSIVNDNKSKSWHSKKKQPIEKVINIYKLAQQRTPIAKTHRTATRFVSEPTENLKIFINIHFRNITIPSRKHHRSITTHHWDTKASPTQSRDITNTKPRHHPHTNKTSQRSHYTSPRHARDITDTSLKDHQNITSTCRKHLDTSPSQRITETSPRYHRIIHETQTKHNRDITETSPKHHQDITET